jgi:hypothetical protein
MESYYLKFVKNIYSQNGEDGVIEKLLEDLKITNGVVVEFGACDGVHLSNTYNLWKDGKFNSVIIEPNPIYNEILFKINEHFNNVETFSCGVSPNREDENSIDNILSQVKKFEITNENLVIMSIDVDSYDYQIFDSLSKFKPKICIVETQSSFGPSVDNISTNQGSSILSLTKLANSKGYELICSTGNAFFLRQDLLGMIPDFDRSVDSLYINNDKILNLQTLPRLQLYNTIFN